MARPTGRPAAHAASALDERLIEEHFVRSPGPGGQNVNKVASAVELRFDVDGAALPEPVKARLRALAGRRMQADGRLAIESHAFRTQGQNREAARERLAALIAAARVAPRARRATRPTTTARQARLDTKKRRGVLKADRRRTGDGE